MILGLIAGGWLRGQFAPREKVQRLLLAGVLGVASGAVFHWLGVCPLVKRIWTPTWTLFSGGCCFLLMAAFYSVIDWRGWRVWSFPLVVIGMNSIAAYCSAHLIEGFVISSLRTHLGPNAFNFFGDTLAPMAQGAAALFILWVLLFWMYQRKLFLRI